MSLSRCAEVQALQLFQGEDVVGPPRFSSTRSSTCTLNIMQPLEDRMRQQLWKLRGSNRLLAERLSEPTSSAPYTDAVHKWRLYLSMAMPSYRQRRFMITESGALTPTPASVVSHFNAAIGRPRPRRQG